MPRQVVSIARWTAHDVQRVAAVTLSSYLLAFESTKNIKKLAKYCALFVLCVLLRGYADF